MFGQTASAFSHFAQAEVLFREFRGSHTFLGSRPFLTPICAQKNLSDRASMVSPAHCSAAERGRVFRRKRAGCLSSPQANEFLPAPKNRLREGRRRPSCTGRFFWYFSWRQEKYTDKQDKKNGLKE